MEVTVVIPTRDRSAVLCETLRHLAAQSGDARFEVIVIDDGSSDGSPEAVRDLAGGGTLDVRLFEQPSLGPAAARNRALAAARAPVCLFLNDDTWPRRDLVQRHACFHRERPEPEAALLGNIVLAPTPPPSPFMRWLAAQHFDFQAIENSEDVGGGRFFTGNVSAKAAFLREAGGFEESFPLAAYEDIELGLRLETRGMRLSHDPAAVVEHVHPLDLEAALRRFNGVGDSLAVLAERHPDWPVPRRPGVRHRIKASALTALSALRLRPRRVKHEVWRFLCHQTLRESYWRSVEGDGVKAGAGGDLRIGRRLRRQALRDGDVRMPA